MPHLVLLKVQCRDPYCQKPATKKVIGWESRDIGDFCLKHAQEVLEEIREGGPPS